MNIEGTRITPSPRFRMKGLTITGICAALMLSFAVPVVAEAQSVVVRNSGNAQVTRNSVVYPKLKSCTLTPSYLCPSRTRFIVKMDPWRSGNISGGYVDWAIDSSNTAVHGTNWVFWPNQTKKTTRCGISGRFCFLQIGIMYDRNCTGTKKLRLKVSGYGADGEQGFSPWSDYPDGVSGVYGIDIKC